MPNTAPIVINDGTSDVTFSPDSVSSTHAVFQDLDATVLAQRELLHYDRPASEKGQVRRSIRLNVPYVEVVNGVNVIKMVSFKGEMVAPSTSPSGTRTRVRKLASAALNNAISQSVFDNPEWFW